MISAKVAVAPALVLMASCAPTPQPPTAPPPGWVRLQQDDAFSFEAPADIKKLPLTPIDSLAAGLKSEQFTVTFDYGMWSNRLEGYAAKYVSHGAVDGRAARFISGSDEEGCIATPDDPPRKFFAGMYVELKPPPNKLALMMFGCAATEDGLKALNYTLRSVRFGPSRRGGR